MTEEKRFIASPGPHLWRGQSTTQIMFIVVLALLLPAGAGVYFYGYRALSVIAVSIAAAVLTEYLVKKLRGKPFVMDGSAVVTGLLLALVLPPTMPLWMVVVGSEMGSVGLAVLYLSKFLVQCSSLFFCIK